MSGSLRAPATASPKAPPSSRLSADCVSLISSGAGQFASSLLGASASGVDAYFFTRAIPDPQVENGNLVKIYDARELGGFPYSPPEVPCKASDECHGAGTPIPPPPTIPSAAGSGGNQRPKAIAAQVQVWFRQKAWQVRAKAPQREATLRNQKSRR